MSSLFDDAFDPAWYRASYPDVELSGLNARVHFEKYGRRLGRPGHADGDPAGQIHSAGQHKVTAGRSRAFVPFTDKQGRRMDMHPYPAFDANPAWHSGPSSALVLPARCERAAALSAPPDLAVHLHLHYPELLPELAGRLRMIPFPFHLYLSVSGGLQPEDTAARLTTCLPGATVHAAGFPNRGRDLAPFCAGFAAQLLKHEFVGHLHGKRSPHSQHKADWRRQLLVNLMGGPDLVRGIFRCFQADPQLGMVFPSYHPSLRNGINWADNYAEAAVLAKRLGVDTDPGRLVLFPAGSFFWARTEALRGLLGAGLSFDDFPEESGQLDGTLAHALERLLGAIVVQAGYDLLQVRADPPFTNYRYNLPEGDGAG